MFRFVYNVRVIRFGNYSSKITFYRKIVYNNHICACKNFSVSSIYKKFYSSKNADIPTTESFKLNEDKDNYVNSLDSTQSIALTIVNHTPSKIQPYLRLMRIDKPIGSWLLFWPCGWGLAMSTAAGCYPDPYYLGLFGIGAFVMRGAGCTINDLWDKNIDSKVARTRDRPLVTGQLTTKDAIIFLAGQLGLGLLVLLQFNWYTVFLGASSLGLVVVYPLMKRITHWPQLVLGMTFNWGILLGWSATQGACYWPACLPLYAAGVCWTIIYDTIYAHQDKVDDILLGLKSTAINFGANTKIWLTSFATAMTGNLIATGIICDQTLPYYLTVGLVSAHLASQIYTLNIDNPTDCAQKFISNYQVGFLLFGGIILGTLFKVMPKKSEDNDKNSSDETNYENH